MLYLYARVSTDKQENGREAQTSRLEKWAAQHGHKVDMLFVDEDVSALSVPLRGRAAGKKLWDALGAGDTVVITKIDRAFRSWADAAVTIDKWKALGVTLEILDMPVDLKTPQGRLFLSQMVAFAQFESEMHGQRKREVYAHKRASGMPYNQLRPYGWVSVKNSLGKLTSWAECREERELGDRILRMRDQGLSYPKIALVLCRENVRKPTRRKNSDGWYHVNDVLCLERAARAGYPRLPRAFWQERDYEQRLDEAKCHGPPLWS